MMYKFHLSGKTNSVILNFDKSLISLLEWYQQLLSESLGKKGKGFFPIISNLPKDNHSLMQLYLDGNKNNFFTIFDAIDQKGPKMEQCNKSNESSERCLAFYYFCSYSNISCSHFR